MPLAVPYDSDVEAIKRTVLEVADEHAGILPNVPTEEKAIMTKILEIPRFKGLFEHDVTVFEPRILIADVSGSIITLSIRIWIREVNRKDEIVSEFWDSVLKRLKKKDLLNNRTNKTLKNEILKTW